MASGSSSANTRREISQNTFERLWTDAKYLLELGVKHNEIITVDRAKPSKTKYREQVNIFGKEKCPKCKGKISQFTIGSRRAFACETCQPVPPNIACMKNIECGWATTLKPLQTLSLAKK